ncbi:MULTISPECIES: HAD family hydrolase [Myroides]|uniref:HAD-IA family hydrolase n=1 Tax=Myroides albus TaxID=2562892 RepID=A0A6I3LMA9_9FLAO|nr:MULTISPECIES: HAD family hydrolase [Myroides]MTG97125.1 HAD-IA family hydrolase [Myroides albus]MVX35142.1 HAD-IA family hydrolase [Myroides sp. LoEW2-1]UVD78867.1 HAD family hydrolase [Myroides albus]
MVKTVIFDMDGVIVDTEPVHRYAYHRHFDELGIEVSEHVYNSFTGHSTKNTYERIKELYGVQGEVKDLVLRKRNLFNDSFDTKADLDLIAGVRPLIEGLYQAGVELIVGSSASKSTIDRVFTRFGLYPFFTHIVSGEDFPKSKPDPTIFLTAASLAKNSDKQDCLIIEDSTNGIKAANAAGIRVIGYKSENSKQQDYTGADYIVRDFREIDAQYIIGLK